MNRVSVFIPVYNEEDILVKNIERLIRYLENQNLVFEIIIGSNGSTDQTVALGQSVAARDKRISFFHLEKKGVGDAFKKGVLSARNDCVISQDMDLATDLGFIDHARTLLNQGYDIVVGSKKMALFDDLSEGKLFVYPHEIKLENGKIPVAHKADFITVDFPPQQPLKEELLHFINCVEARVTPKTDGIEGLRVLKILEKAEYSLRKKSTG